MTILLDGGMGQELRRRGLNENAKVAGMALLDSPDAVRDVHKEFIAAGAEVITTWNYAITPQRLALSGFRDKLNDMTRAAADLANEARGNAASVRIAGSLPPLRASYEPNSQDLDSMAEEYAEIADLLAPSVDLFICETMSSVGEAVAAARAAAVHGKPIWVSLTLRDEGDGRLRSGETVEAALNALDGLPVEAVLFNCCDASAITAAMPSLHAATDLPIGAYANAFTPIDKEWKRTGSKLRDLRNFTPKEYAQHVADWRAAGAEIVGGCCGIGPEHIAYLRAELDQIESGE